MIIDGVMIAQQIHEEIRQQIAGLVGRPPCLAVVLVGDHPASKIYVQRKTKACAAVGITSIKRELPATLTTDELLQEIDALNRNPTVDGILVQLPLPKQIDTTQVLHQIDPSKDVDGLHPLNSGKLFLGDPSTFIPCTPLGIKVLLERSNIEVAGKHAVILGRSNLVGKPMAAILMQNALGGNATVTVAHSKSADLKKLCLMADVLIAAMGQPQFVTADMVKEGAVVIDVGINKIADNTSKGYQIVGDVDFDRVKDKASAITPVPGGVGPMTIAMLLSNTLKAQRLSW